MTTTHGRTEQPNTQLQQLLASSAMSHKALAHRVNQLAQRQGLARGYTHTSVANWVHQGMTPHPPIPSLIAVALGERLGRPVSPAEIGMSTSPRPASCMGLEFARDPADALRVAADFWSAVHRRDILGSAFAVSAYATPVTRWLVKPTDPATGRRGGPRVGRRDLQELWTAADQARSWDSESPRV